MFKLLRATAIAAGVLLGLQLDAAADPITYDGTLTAGVGSPGEIPPSSSVEDATDADYWRFWATTGDNVTVIVDRVDSELDPAQFVYHGLYAFTTDVGLTNGTDNLTMGTNLIDFADDERPNPGPFGDPESIFVAPVTGWYTVAVAEFLSGVVPQDGEFDYVVTVRGNTGSPVPEPALLALLACGACGVTLSRRRKSA